MARFEYIRVSCYSNLSRVTHSAFRLGWRRRRGGGRSALFPALPAAIIDDGAHVSQRVGGGALADAAAKACAANLRGPTIVIVGTVVSLREKLNWYAPERATQRRRDLPPTEGAQ